MGFPTCVATGPPATRTGSMQHSQACEMVVQRAGAVAGQIDDGGIGLQPHTLAQTVQIDRCDARPLLRLGCLPFYNASKDKGIMWAG